MRDRLRLAFAFAFAFAFAACHTKPETKAVPTEETALPTPNDAAAPQPGPSTAAGGWIGDVAETKPVDRATALAALAKSQHRSLLVYQDTVEECSSMGGSHAFFQMTLPRPGVVHFGGHGANLRDAFHKGEVWVGGYDPLDKPESVKNPAWCVPDRTIDARATALVPVANNAEALRLLDDLAK